MLRGTNVSNFSLIPQPKSIINYLKQILVFRASQAQMPELARRH